MKKYSNIFIKAVMAGCAISLGALANICSQNKIAGSLFFGIGLFLILVWKLNLFTGKVCSYLEDPDLSITDLLVIYAGNFLGCIIFGYLMRISVQPQLVDSLRPSLEFRITNSPLNILILGFFCNICIYVAVKGYGKLSKEWERMLSVFLGVSVFILCGFEHCIADIFYVTLCNLWNWSSALFILYVTAGNILGGITIPIICKCMNRGKQ